MKWRGLLVAILVIVLIFLSVPRLFFIPQLHEAIEADLREALHSEQVQVRLKSQWGWDLLFGRISSLAIVIEDATIDGLDVARVEIQGQDILFQPTTLWRERELVLTDTTDLWGEIVIAEDAVNDLFWREVDPERNLSIDVDPEGLGLRGSLAFWNTEWTITLRGDLQVRNGSALRFVVKNLEVEETRIPPVLLEILSESYDFGINFGSFPYPVEITDIHFLEHQIIVTFGGLP